MQSSIPQTVFRYWVIEVARDGACKVVADAMTYREADNLATGFAASSDSGSLFCVAEPKEVYATEPRRARRTFLDVAPVVVTQELAAPPEPEAEGHAPC